MDGDTRPKLIAMYKDGYRAVSEALTGATDAELDTQPKPGKWSAREVVHHVADSEMTAAIRLRLLLVVDNPQIVGFDQDEFARKLYYAERPTEASLEAFKAARRTTAELLDRMTDADWRRLGTHTRARLLFDRALARNLLVARAQTCRADPRRPRRRPKEQENVSHQCCTLFHK